MNAQPVPRADLCFRHLQGHEALANRLPSTNSSAAYLSYSCIRCKIEPFVCFDFILLDALAKSVADANIVE